MKRWIVRQTVMERYRVSLLTSYASWMRALSIPGGGKGTSIPSLEEVLAIMPRNIWLNCHLKGGAEEARLTAQAIKKANRLHQTVLACGMEAAQAARLIAPDIIICNMEGQFRKSPDKYIDHTSEISAGFLQLVHGSKPTQSQIAEAKRRGILVNYFFSE